MQRTCAVLIAVVGLFAMGADWGDRAPVARVLQIQGTADLSESESTTRPVAVYGTIYVDEKLKLAERSQVTLVFRADGHLERIVKAGQYQITKTGCRPKSGVEQVAMSEQAKATIGKVSKGPRGIVQGGVVLARSPAPPPKDNEPANDDASAESPMPLADPCQIRPLPDTTLLAAKPAFSWPAVPEAKKYTVNLYHLGNRVWSAQCETAKIEYAGDEPLEPAATYWWDVSTSIQSKTVSVCEGSFQMAGDRQREEAAALEKLLDKPDVLNLAVAALWYRQNGFVHEALAANEQLAKLSPSSAVYRELSRLYFESGRRQEGEAAESKATKMETP
jgi:hypothetical protein